MHYNVLSVDLVILYLKWIQTAGDLAEKFFQGTPHATA
jgi:hypothetical protein